MKLLSGISKIQVMYMIVLIWLDAKLCKTKPDLDHDDIIGDVAVRRILPSIFMFRIALMPISRRMDPADVNIVIIFLGYTWLKKISRSRTFPDRMSKVKVTEVIRWPWHLNGRNSVNFWSLNMKQNLNHRPVYTSRWWNTGHSYGYNGNQDSVSRSVSKIAWNHIWRPY